jgi:HEAT repeat protein
MLELDHGGDAAAVIAGAYGSGELTSRLAQLLERDDSSVRARAAHALGGTRDQRALGPLKRTAEHDQSSEVIRQALRALGRIGGDIAKTALVDALAHANAEVRDVAVEELERIGDERTVEQLLDRIDDAEIETAESIIQALSAIKGSGAIECLVDLLMNDDLTDQAAEALIEIGDEDAVVAVRELYEDTEDYGLIERCRYILESIHFSESRAWPPPTTTPPQGPGPLLWREKDREFTDQLLSDDETDAD